VNMMMVMVIFTPDLHTNANPIEEGQGRPQSVSYVYYRNC